MNGTRDAGEVGVAGWPVALYDSRSQCVRDPDVPNVCNPVPADSTTTAKDGSFAFDGVPDQTTVCLTLSVGWVVTSSSASGVSPDCPTGRSPPNSVSVYADPTQYNDIQFGVAEADVRLAAETSCPTTVAIERDFECSVSIRNAGAVNITNALAYVNGGVCWDYLPARQGPGCLPQGTLGVPFLLAFISSNPPWTGMNPQYGNPGWNPLLAGSLGPNDTVLIKVTLRARALNGPGEHEQFCGGGMGHPTFGDHPSPQLMLASSCVQIAIGGQAGDLNCDSSVNSLDALLLLQHIAGLLATLPCPSAAADINGDGFVYAIDAALILQFDAGLLDHLPVA
jgi:hypothetical protein